MVMAVRIVWTAKDALYAAASRLVMRAPLRACSSFDMIRSLVKTNADASDRGGFNGVCLNGTKQKKKLTMNAKHCIISLLCC
jgi:hypothetical protein